MGEARVLSVEYVDELQVYARERILRTERMFTLAVLKVRRDPRPVMFGPFKIHPQLAQPLVCTIEPRDGADLVKFGDTVRQAATTCDAEWVAKFEASKSYPLFQAEHSAVLLTVEHEGRPQRTWGAPVLVLATGQCVVGAFEPIRPCAEHMPKRLHPRACAMRTVN